ncbi:MAG: dCMP deaminase family protein [Alphaproteobacteria bacterium]|nr:dCMP deaminase family protein [Alphaproteobacteria bacterium]MBN2674887.1 dCMP deaminase family protein [Alphaproteobacteria bacterium]
MNQKFTFNDKWNLRFLELARHISTWSKDDSTKVGCVIIGPDKEIRSTGYNGLPRGVDDSNPERIERPIKYSFFEHAERNAIYNATLCGTSLRNCSLYVTVMPCADCARAIIQSGIKEVFFCIPDQGSEKAKLAGWRESIKYSLEMFDESGVKYKIMNISE